MPDSKPERIARFVELGQFAIDDESVRLLNQQFCRERHAVILGVVERDGTAPITVGILNKKDAPLRALLEQILGRVVEPVQLNAYEITRALDLVHGGTQLIDDAFHLILRPVARLSNEPNLSAIRVIDEILGRAIFLGASDVHVETYEDDVDVRLRIDGVLHQINNPLNRSNVREVISRLKILASLDIADHFTAQDGRLYGTFYPESLQGADIDFRLSIVPGPFGEDVVIRVLDSRLQLAPFEDLGFPSAVQTRFRDLVNSADGLVLVTGPTGSGKTTTLYSALDLINNDTNKVLTVEDPIEYRFPKINQKQVSSHMGFADYAKAFLRQDPEVIMIGEVRDEDTASIAIRAAQTGHLVLSTVHTNDAASAVPRLRTLGLDANLIASTLLGALAQRLVRTICAECKIPAPADDPDQRIASATDGGRSMHGAGCDACHGTGYSGRTGLFELFRNDGDIPELIAHDAPLHELRGAARARGMGTLLEDGITKVASGVTTPAELRRVISYRLFEEQ